MLCYDFNVRVFAAVLFKAKGKGRFDSRRFGNFVSVSSSFRPRVAPVDSF